MTKEKIYSRTEQKVDYKGFRYRSLGRICWLEGGGKQGLIDATNVAVKCMQLGAPFVKVDAWTKSLKFAHFEEGSDEVFKQAWEQRITKTIDTDAAAPPAAAAADMPPPKRPRVGAAAAVVGEDCVLLLQQLHHSNSLHTRHHHSFPPTLPFPSTQPTRFHELPISWGDFRRGPPGPGHAASNFERFVEVLGAST
eukprot:6222714-Pyramimonas_sp.AAC.1